MNDGQVRFSSLAAVAGFSAVTVNGKMQTSAPGLQYTGTTPATFDKPVTVNGGLAQFNATSTAGPLSVTGPVTGSGGLLINTTDDVVLTNAANSYGGSTRVTKGTLVIGSDAVLGNSPVVDLATGSAAQGLRLTGDWTTARTLSVSNTSILDTNGFNATLNGRLVGADRPGNSASDANLTKAGAGRLTLTQPTDFGLSPTSATLTVTGGELRVTNATGSATGFATVIVRTGAQLSGTGGIANSVVIDTGGTLAPGNDGVGTLRLSQGLSLAGTYRVDAAGGVSDRVGLTGQLDLSSGSTLDLSAGVFEASTTYTLATFGNLSSTANSFTNVIGLPATHQLVHGAHSLDLVPAPEPGLALLVGAGGLAALARRRRGLFVRSNSL